jgi:universal stress protein E
MDMTTTPVNRKATGDLNTAHEFRSILAEIDTSAKSQPALDVAAALAHRRGARLRIVNTRLTAPGGDMKAPHHVLLREVERFGHDLVIRSREPDWIANRAGREDTVNRSLFRSCPSPVWAVGVRPKLMRPTILAAVNVLTYDRLTEALNASAIRFAARIASLLDGDIIVFHAWRQPAEKRFLGHLAPAHFGALLQTAAGRVAEALHRLVGSFGGPLRGCRIELRRGPAEQAIPRFVVDEGIDIVVAGARGERGIWPLVFGSTTERLLRETTCSVIAVKDR